MSRPRESMISFLFPMISSVWTSFPFVSRTTQILDNALSTVANNNLTFEVLANTRNLALASVSCSAVAGFPEAIQAYFDEIPGLRDRGNLL